ncbi:MAG: hypothetical protein KIT80_09615 [Chitinophagaceae bacterium]|nr:hypothetical protein [Chitinophagaceae bacterium]MCW5927156.1 hypothetical protein [Chitinophagaceae bacterium]
MNKAEDIVSESFVKIWEKGQLLQRPWHSKVTVILPCVMPAFDGWITNNAGSNISGICLLNYTREQLFKIIRTETIEELHAAIQSL